MPTQAIDTVAAPTRGFWGRAKRVAPEDEASAPIAQTVNEALAALRTSPEPHGLSRAGHESPRVSIIVTAYNAGEFIEASVRSLLAQTLPDLEVLVVDDHSGDDTLAVLNRLQAEDDRVRVLSTPMNSGTYIAKNIGLLHARGTFVAFQDSDDISHPGRIEAAVRRLEANQNLVAVSCHYCRIDEDQGRLQPNRGEWSRSGLISLVLRWNEVRNRVGYFDSVRVNADDEYKTRIRMAFGNEAITDTGECHYVALLRKKGLTGEGHTRNRLNEKSIKRFLAPVRQQYTSAFQAYHRSAVGEELFVGFPGTPRRFPAPVSIDPLFRLRAERVVLLLDLGRDIDDRERAIIEGSIGRRKADEAIVLAPALESSPEAEEGGEATGNPPAKGILELPHAESWDSTVKMVFDRMGDAALVVLTTSDCIDELDDHRFELTLFELTASRRERLAYRTPRGSLYLFPGDLDISAIKLADRHDRFVSAMLELLRRRHYSVRSTHR